MASVRERNGLKWGCGDVGVQPYAGHKVWKIRAWYDADPLIEDRV